MKTFIEFSVILRWFLFFTQASTTLLGATENGERMEEKEEREERVKGYDCGKVFFTDQMVQEAVTIASIREGARPYIGPLYDNDLGYLTWPIAQDEITHQIKGVPKWNLWREAVYQVVFDMQGKVIDVIVKITNFDFVKCWRGDNTESETQSFDINNINDYYCGQRLITKEDLEISLGFARNKLGGGLVYPALYTGHLYDKKLGYRIWPIYLGQDFYRSAYGPGGPYFIVIDPEGQLRDVIARTACYGEFYVKCMISKNAPFSTVINSKISVGPPKTGFDCDGIFFDENDLQSARGMAKNARQKKFQNTYPLMYKGPPFDSLCYLWPLQPYGKRVIPGKVLPYRLVLSPRFEIMYVVIQSGDNIKKCERKTISGGHLLDDQNKLQCGYTVFTSQELTLAAKTACTKLGLRRSMYPRPYVGIEFDVPGPYYIYPINKGNINRGHPGKHRLIINYNCLIAGALTSKKGTQEFFKCKALKTAQSSMESQSA